jgi:hypothetical protein
VTSRPLAGDIAAWTDAAAEASGARDRGFLASAFTAEAARLEREQGVAARALFLRGALQALIARDRPRIATLNLPPAVKALVEKEYRRIESDIATAGDAHFDLASHSMRCDFRIVGFGRIPVGVHHIEIGGVPRRLLWSGGAAQAWRAAILLARAGGRAPFYVSHFSHGIKPHAFLMVYTPDALVTWHRNVAECLRINPHIRGLLATSWWYDPQLARVAPHLAFLREGSLAHGAIQLRSGSTEGAQKFAIANSVDRQRMYASGEYVPVSYAMLWTRGALLQWADSQPG